MFVATDLPFDLISSVIPTVTHVAGIPSYHLDFGQSCYSAAPVLRGRLRGEGARDGEEWGSEVGRGRVSAP